MQGPPHPNQPVPGQSDSGQGAMGRPMMGQPQQGYPQQNYPQPGYTQQGQPNSGPQGQAQPYPQQMVPVPQPGQQPPPGAIQLPVPVQYGQQSPQPVQYVIMPHPAYFGQQAIDMVNAEEEQRERNWRRLMSLLALLALATVALLWYGYTQGSLFVAPTGSLDITEEGVITDIVADARIQPARQVGLSLPEGGIISERFVQDGDLVEAGQALMSLDNARQVVAVAQAQAALDQATARLEELETGARSQELIAAQAAVDAAQARYDNLTAEVSSETISAAEAQVAAAQAALQDLLSGPDTSAEIEANAEVRAAEAAVTRAQRAYDQVKWRNDIGQLPESQALQEATTELEAAQARAQQKLKGPSSAEISQARAEVKEAEAELQQVRNPVPQGDIDAAAAELRSAQASLELVESGARSEQVSLAQAEVSSAQAMLLEAEVALKETELVAPYDGIVVELQADVGEFVNPGTPVIQLGDLTTLKFETELEDSPAAALIDEGMPVLIKVEELDDLAMTGAVTSVRENSINGQKAWTVFVEPDEVDERLTWKMRSQIFFDFE